MFAKLLERWSLYASAQQIFVYLLARADMNSTTTFTRKSNPFSQSK